MAESRFRQGLTFGDGDVSRSPVRFAEGLSVAFRRFVPRPACMKPGKEVSVSKVGGKGGSTAAGATIGGEFGVGPPVGGSAVPPDLTRPYEAARNIAKEIGGCLLPISFRFKGRGARDQGRVQNAGAEILSRVSHHAHRDTGRYNVSRSTGTPPASRMRRRI